MMVELFGEKVPPELDTVVGVVGALLQRADEKKSQKESGQDERDETSDELDVSMRNRRASGARVDLGA